MLSKCLDHATPAQRVVQVLGGHSVEASSPFFQPQLVGVLILDAVDAGQNLDPFVEIHGPMGHAHVHFPMVFLWKNRIGSRSRATQDHQNRNLLPGELPLCGPSTPFPGSSRKLAPLPLAGSQKSSLIGFDDSPFLPGFQAGRQGQEPLFPKKGGFRIDPAPPERLADRLPFSEFFQKEPLPVLLVQSRKDHVRQCIEGSIVSTTPEARELGDLPQGRISEW